MGLIEGKRVFLSGPMTGLPDFNREGFAEARRACEAMGATVVFNPREAWGHTDKDRSWYMRRDLHRLTLSDGDEPMFDLVVQLDGWEHSNGAWCESRVAEECGIPCVPLANLMTEVDDGDDD